MDNPLNTDADGQSAIEANKLCQSCGICCNGALFSYVSVSGSEAKVLEKEGVTLKKADKNTYRFNLPCTKFKDGGCSIYTSRPKKCASFYCKLAESVLNESVSFEDAHSHVVTLKLRMDWLNKRIESMPDLEPENDVKMGLRDYIGVFCFNTMKIISKKQPTQEEQEFIKYAFESVKLVHRYFWETSLLAKYAALVQKIQYTPARISRISRTLSRNIRIAIPNKNKSAKKISFID